MVTQVVEIAEEGRYLCRFRGFMIIRQATTEVGRVPLDDITALILSARQITLSRALMEELAERQAPLVTCGKNYHPLAFSVPYGSHFDQTGILWAQVQCRQPLAKRIWQSVVREKIANQCITLAHFHAGSPVLKQLTLLVRQVQSGDPDNREAQAARLYWPVLLGKNFRRDRYGGAENTLLNYGYSILRAATARAVCGAGLTPAIGIHHHNRKNPFALVDDFMEPFRPLVDMTVRQIVEAGDIPAEPLSPAIKRQLTKILDYDVRLEKGVSTVMNALHRLAQTFVISLAEKKNKVEFPTLRRVGELI